MPVPSYTISCLQNRLIAPDVYEIRFTKPKEFTFKAGQFVLFDVPLLEDPADIQTRAYSIASASHEPDLLFVIKLTPGGRASRWIVEALKEGTQVRMQGPFGMFTLNRKSDKESLLIGTGTGIAPFRSFLMESIHLGDTRKTDVVFGVRTETDLFWVDELQTLVQQHGNIFLHMALSAPTEAWKGHRGRVQTLVPLLVKDFSRTSLYACGSPAMTKDIKRLALEEWGLQKPDVHVEGYI